VTRGYYLEAAASIFWCADLDECDEGTAVTIWQIPAGGGVRRRAYHDILPLPLHAAANEVQAILNRLGTPTTIQGS